MLLVKYIHSFKTSVTRRLTTSIMFMTTVMLLQKYNNNNNNNNNSNNNQSHNHNHNHNNNNIEYRRTDIQTQYRHSTHTVHRVHTVQTVQTQYSHSTYSTDPMSQYICKMFFVCWHIGLVAGGSTVLPVGSGEEWEGGGKRSEEGGRRKEGGGRREEGGGRKGEEHYLLTASQPNPTCSQRKPWTDIFKYKKKKKNLA